MGFMNNIIIYEGIGIKIYINQCHAKGRKTNLYAIRRNDESGLCDYIGGIEWSGRWRQYVFTPDKDTQWSNSCLRKIIDFIDKINKAHREKLRRKK